MTGVAGVQGHMRKKYYFFKPIYYIITILESRCGFNFEVKIRKSNGKKIVNVGKIGGNRGKCTIFTISWGVLLVA